VLSMQNGVGNAAVASAAAPSLRVLAGMVPYNVAEVGPGRFHRGTTGTLAAQDDPELRDWAVAFEHAGLDWEKYVEIDDAYKRPAEVDYLRGDASKAKSVLGWEPTVRTPELARLMVDADIAALADQLAGRAVRVDRG